MGVNVNFDEIWDDAFQGDDLMSTDQVVTLMSGCGQSLKKRTDGKVYGRFRGVKNLAGFDAMQEFAKRASSALQVDDNLMDANELYANRRFAFDIISGSYRFRLFSVILTPIYPIALSFDEGVLKDMDEASLITWSDPKSPGLVTVENDEELMSAFSSAVSTKKVRYLLERLCRDDAGAK